MEGNTVLYVMRESMTLNSVPLVPDAIRGRVKSLSLHTECPNGTIEHVHFSYLNPFGSVPAFLFKPTQLRMNTLVERYAELIHFKRMLELSKHCTTFFPHSQYVVSIVASYDVARSWGATFMLSSRHFPKDSETTYQSNRSLLSMPTSRRGYKTPSTKQATLSMIPPLRG
ncbi:hypothetical protein DYB38_004191 [Aphanomyces astaci]|uniref:START domain-containing protein n=1 Tax=Aphanomyces astaci TaxID=112090 RepID=A0A397F1M1_APHAT|nr:hypothetical protein DYB38_004191 [Aphanomyces astaci]RHY44262.1 hypothetical protein DYB34_004844 [Aphanomyces astaci]RHZ05400.1 hypothetical protein DYB31_005125 [Aphanomyces astaci]